MLGANVEAEDADGDTALHLVLLQMKNSREATSAMTFLLNVLFRVEPKNMDKAPAISKARPITLCFHGLLLLSLFIASK